MKQELDSILNGAPFHTPQSVARVVRRLHVEAAEEVLLLSVAPSSRLPAYEAWTTVSALTLALETGGWAVCRSEHEVASALPASVQ